MLIRILTTVLILTSLINAQPSAYFIKETREKIAQINISFLGNILPEKTSIIELEKLLNKLKDEKILPDSIIDNKDFKNKDDRLIESFKTFEKLFQDNPEVDTQKKAFRVVNNNFNSLYGRYFLDELNKSSKQKIIVFSTSMSCECTLEMCYKQECEIQRLYEENPGLFDFAVVDSYSNFDLQNEYDVGFIPSVIVANKEGKEIKRFVRSEKLYNELNPILKIKAYKND